MSYDRERYQSVILEQLRYNADDVRRCTGNVQRYVRSLVASPPFTTKAEAAIEDAETTLTEALLAIKLAKNEYAKKPKLQPKPEPKSEIFVAAE